LVDIGILKQIWNESYWSSLCCLLSFLFAVSCLLATKLFLHHFGVVGHLLADVLVVPHVTDLEEILDLERIRILEQI
jgi:hypothetical protein